MVGGKYVSSLGSKQVSEMGPAYKIAGISIKEEKLGANATKHTTVFSEYSCFMR